MSNKKFPHGTQARTFSLVARQVVVVKHLLREVNARLTVRDTSLTLNEFPSSAGERWEYFIHLCRRLWLTQRVRRVALCFFILFLFRVNGFTYFKRLLTLVRFILILREESRTLALLKILPLYTSEETVSVSAAFLSLSLPACAPLYTHTHIFFS